MKREWCWKKEERAELGQKPWKEEKKKIRVKKKHRVHLFVDYCLDHPIVRMFVTWKGWLKRQILLFSSIVTHPLITFDKTNMTLFIELTAFYIGYHPANTFFFFFFYRQISKYDSFHGSEGRGGSTAEKWGCRAVRILDFRNLKSRFSFERRAEHPIRITERN